MVAAAGVGAGVAEEGVEDVELRKVRRRHRKYLVKRSHRLLQSGETRTGQGARRRQMDILLGTTLSHPLTSNVVCLWS